MPVSYAGGVSTVTASISGDGTVTCPVYMSACIAQAELAGLTGNKITDSTFTTKTIAGITIANPCVFYTTTAHVLKVGDRVYLNNISGLTNLSDRTYIVNTVPTTTSFTLKTYRASTNTYNSYDVLDTSTFATSGSGAGNVYRLSKGGVAYNLRFSPQAYSFLMVDREMSFTWAGSTYYTPAAETIFTLNNGAYTVLGYHSTINVETTTTINDTACLGAATGGGFISLRTPSGQNPQIVHIAGNTRNDFPTFTTATQPAEFIIEGLTKVTYTDSQKWYVGASRNISGGDKLNNLYLGGSTGDMFQVSAGINEGTSTYNTPIVASLQIGGEALNSNINVIGGIFGAEVTTPSALNWATIRQGRNWLTDCTLQNWDGTMTKASPSNGCYGGLRYTNAVTVKSGSTPISGAIVNRVTSVRTAGSGYNLSVLLYGAQAATRFQTTSSTGLASDTCIDTITGQGPAGGLTTGVAGTQESYKYTSKVRKYDYKTPSDTIYNDRIYGYGGSLGPITEEIQVSAVNDLSLTQEQASALTSFSLAPSGTTSGTVSISGNCLSNDLWCYYRNWISTTTNFTSNDTWSYSGTTVNLGNWNLLLYPNITLTGSVTTTNGVTLGSGANITGIITSSTGTNVPITAPNIIQGSRVQLYNVTDAVEMDNSLVATSGGYTFRYNYVSDKTVRLRVAYCVGLTAKEKIESLGLLTSTGLNFIDTQTDDTVYNGNLINGSLVTEYSADYANIQVDANDVDGVSSPQNIYAFTIYNETTSGGIANLFGIITADDEVNYRVDVTRANLKLQNTNPSKALMVVGGRIYRSDGSNFIDNNSYSVFMEPSKAYAAASATIQLDLSDIKINTNLIPHTIK